jgi:hypothetical protein
MCQHAPIVLRDIQDHFLMAVAEVKCGSIDPSASNLSLLIKPAIHQYIHPSKVCCGIVDAVDPRGGFCVVRSDLVGAVGPTFMVSGPWT